jgi:hypothetical protein
MGGWVPHACTVQNGRVQDESDETWSTPTFAMMRAPRPVPGVSCWATRQPDPAAHRVQSQVPAAEHTPPAIAGSTALLRRRAASQGAGSQSRTQAPASIRVVRAHLTILSEPKQSKSFKYCRRTGYQQSPFSQQPC